MERARRAKKVNQRKLAALQQLRDARDHKVSRSEQLQLEEPEDVYELVDEEQYEELVRQRRQRDDFVVDDVGLGYYDDGEEHLGIVEPGEKRRDEDRTLKKARKLNELARDAQANSMLKFVSLGQTVSAKPAANAKELKAKAETLDLESLLGNLDSAVAPTARPGSVLRPSLPSVHRVVHRPVQPITPIAPAKLMEFEHEPVALNLEDDDAGPVFDDDDNNDDYHGQTASQTEEGSQPEARATSAVADEAAEQAVSASQPEAQPVKKLKVGAKSAKMLKATAPVKAAAAAASGKSTSMPDKPDLANVKFDGFAADLAEASAPIGAEAPNLQAVIETDEQGPFVKLFWMDATEIDGVVYLFGKVQRMRDGKPFYDSCSVAVHGMERNLFVLAKPTGEFNADGTPVRAPMTAVYEELRSLLVPNCIPKQAGQGFRCKPVRRKYAFEYEDVPREETEYLKVAYSAKHRTPAPEVCQGGRTYSRIFGASTSTLELFLLKRKLQGPSWIVIRDPLAATRPFSWCRLEFIVDSPKKVQRMTESPPSPPLVTMTISMKTVVNPQTHTHEIVAISALTHVRTDADSGTDLSPNFMRQFVLVRPLGTSAAPGYPQTFPHDLQAELARSKGNIIAQTNERALLSMFFQRLQTEDPDVLVSHNLFGFEFNVLLSRALDLKLPVWSKLGRLRRTVPPKAGVKETDVAAGRLLCDTYLAAKEFLRETMYSLQHLAASQLKIERVQVEPLDVPRYFGSSTDIVRLASHTAFDAQLVQRLVARLQVIPLTKQLTNLSGNLWRRTMLSKRAERIEYLLLHEFHKLKYILPERKPIGSKRRFNDNEEDANDDDKPSNSKKTYVGGLVLEPKKGLYDKCILLLDFNSLYPSIIQEYNLCFTTINWPQYAKARGEGGAKADADEEDDGDEQDVTPAISATELPPLPDVSSQGVLPRVIKHLVDRRAQVKKLLKKETDNLTREQLDIRQKALKLTANSMYGCLGFTFSRFYAWPIAALVTAMGREALSRTVDLATNQMGLDVIYGDTDSVMINTNTTDIAAVKELGNQVKREVNKLYRALELDMDGIFRSMLLLKKKKYAAVVVVEKNGQVTFEKEMKGLDLVRRDWCKLSKEAGRYVLDQILSGEARETVINNIHEHLHDLATRARANEIDLEQYVITKGLNKSPKEYPDVKGQPHLQVALRMLKADIPVNVGDHIPYVICKSDENLPPAQRAYHPDEVRRSDGKLQIDVEWYLSQQILPPIARLCEPIEGTSQGMLSEQLGLDASKYARRAADDLLDEGWGFTPRSKMDDSERFKSCAPLTLVCAACRAEVPLRGVYEYDAHGHMVSALSCGECKASLYGFSSVVELYTYISNRMTLFVRACLKRYYDGWLVCDDHSCGRRTQQQSVNGYMCVENCHGRMVPEYDESALHCQLQYLETLFDVQRAFEKMKPDEKFVASRSGLSAGEAELFRLLHLQARQNTNQNAYNWIRPSLWSTVFSSRTTPQT